MSCTPSPLLVKDATNSAGERERVCVCVRACVRARVLSVAAFVRAGGAIRDSDYPLTLSHAPLSVQRRVLFNHPTSTLPDIYFINCVQK